MTIKSNYPAVGPQKPTCTRRLKLYSVQNNLLALATGELAHELNCKMGPLLRERRAHSGSPSLGLVPWVL